MKKIKLSPAKVKFVKCAQSLYGEESVISKKQVQDVTSNHNLGLPSWFTRSPFTVNRGMYKLPNLDGNLDIEVTTIPSVTKSSSETMVSYAKPVEKETPKMVSNVIEFPSNTESYVPAKVGGYVKFGHYNDVKTIKKAGSFYPIFITGLSGNGKTLMVEQLHAELGKELIRLNITIETDEDDLLGGFRLVNGETKFVPGPVIEAMERGCTLLLDECDLGSNKLLALQPVLEGKGVFLKKVNKWITAKPGFNVMATANTKGKGSEDGRFIGTNILNEAFLERFAITIEQPYPTAAIEKKIVMGSMKKYGEVDEEFATNLVTWAEVIRKTFYDGGVDEIISTRRLDHIVKAFTIFKDKMTAIEMCVARFDDDTKESFIDLYTKVDAGVMTAENGEEAYSEDAVPTDDD